VPAEFNSGMSSILARAVELERRRQAKEIDRLGSRLSMREAFRPHRNFANDLSTESGPGS
jgi:hypothetical protein